MDVYLLTYDLSQGLARQMSQSLLGFHLDAVYHTSIEFGGREWVYDGGIVSIVPGSSHLGRPMERILLGETELPMDVVEEYIDSIREIFTLQAYDLFRHNCNNFSDSLAKFLIGKGIPEHIITMPQRVLRSPMGAMMYQQLSQSVNSTRQGGSILGIQQNGSAAPAAPSATATSSAPRKPSHFHDSLDVPSFKNATSAKFVEFTKVPPMEKLFAKLGQTAENEAVVSLKSFIETRAKEGAVDATLPDLKKVSDLFEQEIKSDALDKLFPLADLLRCALVDPRISGHFAQEETTMISILAVLDENTPYALRLVSLQMACNLFASPIFADKALPRSQSLRTKVLQLITTNLLDEKHDPTRVAAASLAFNVALADRRVREESAAVLQEEDQAELAASLVEGISREAEPQEALDAMLMALGHLAFRRARQSELAELLNAVEAAGIAGQRKTFDGPAKTKKLAAEVERLLVSLKGDNDA